MWVQNLTLVSGMYSRALYSELGISVVQPNGRKELYDTIRILLGPRRSSRKLASRRVMAAKGVNDMV